MVGSEMKAKAPFPSSATGTEREFNLDLVSGEAGLECVIVLAGCFEPLGVIDKSSSSGVWIRFQWRKLDNANLTQNI